MHEVLLDTFSTNLVWWRPVLRVRAKLSCAPASGAGDARAQMSAHPIYTQAGMIIDDEINVLLVNPLPPNVRLHAVIDACHSGTAMDLEYR